MKIECSKERLYKIISKVDKISGKNLTLPVLNCVLLVVKSKSLIIKATNLDLGVEFTLPVKSEKEGVVAIPAGVISNYLSSIKKDDNVLLESNDNNLLISTKNSSAIIKTKPYEDFPLIPKISKNTFFNITKKELVSGLRSVWYSASISSIKPELSSVFIYTSDKKLFFVATDSFRLAEKQILLKTFTDFPAVLIPAKNVGEIIKIIDDGDDEVEVMIEKNQIAFSSNNYYLTSRVVEGTFPDYKQIIPKEFITEVITLKEDLLNTTRAVNIFSDKFNQIGFKVNVSKKTLELSAKNNDLGEGKERMGGSFSGEDIEINFNHKYIIDCFQSLIGESVSLKFNGMHKPLVIRSTGDNSFLYLVMPMNR